MQINANFIINAYIHGDSLLGVTYKSRMPASSRNAAKNAAAITTTKIVFQ